MYEINEPAEAERYRKPGPMKMFWITMGVAMPIAFAVIAGLMFLVQGVFQIDTPPGLLGFITGAVVTQIVSIFLKRHFAKKERLANV